MFTCWCFQVQKSKQVLQLRERLSELHRTDDLNWLDQEVQRKRYQPHDREPVNSVEKSLRDCGFDDCSADEKVGGNSGYLQLELIARCVETLKRCERSSWSNASKVLLFSLILFR